MPIETGTRCTHCGIDAGVKPDNEGLWAGFYDADTHEYVCMPCRRPHYALKAKGKFAGQYSELPVIPAQERLKMWTIYDSKI